MKPHLATAPLVTLESQTPVAEFDVWAFTISFEMDYFNVVAMLRQAGVPPLAADRSDADGSPLLIAGGPGISANPEVLAPFFDAIVIGEAEDLLPRLIDILRDGVHEDREALLDALDRLPGVYVPSRHASSPGRQIERLWVADMAKTEPVSCLYTPDTEFGHMHLIEIARGCGRGCRFCLAGMSTGRPASNRSIASSIWHARRWSCGCRSTRMAGRREAVHRASAWSRRPCPITRGSTSWRRSCGPWAHGSASAPCAPTRSACRW